MTRFEPSFRFHRTVLALAACAACTAFAPVQAQTPAEEPKAETIRIQETTVSVGLGGVDGSSADRALFSQYNGLRNGRNAVGMLGVDYFLRDDAQDKWVTLQGSDLLGDSRELNLVWKEPGNWRFKANYGELVHRDPNTVNTGLVGAGSTTPLVVPLPGGPGTGTDLELKTKRTSLGIGFAKWINPALQFEIDAKSEKKEGSRLFGIGMNCPSPIAPGCLGTTGIHPGWATLMLPEPVNSSHTQIEARLNYAAEQLSLSLGYYGSFYRNSNSTLTAGIPGSLNNALGTLQPLNTGLQAILSRPVALSPDNQAHQLDLTGTYDLTRTTRATFKLAYTKATQHDDFASANLTGAPAGTTNLGGEVTTKLARIGLTARPMPKLSLVADLRYEDRDDNTPIAPYNLEGTSVYTNRNLPNQKTRGKLQANWQFSSDYKGSVGTDYEAIDRGTFTASSAVSGISALRQKTTETGVNAELRRRMSENVSGAVRVSSSKRDGSNWLRNNSGLGVTEITNPADPANSFLSTSIFMPTLADRQRDKVKVNADWQPSESLMLQVSAEGGTDKYSSLSSYGVRDTRMSQFSLDWGYTLSDKWSLNGYASRGTQTLNQARPAGYVMAFDNTNIGAGFGFTGKPMSKLEIGGSLSYVDDKSVYAQTLDTFAGADSAALLAASGGLPNVVFRQTSLKLFGKYELDKRSSVRVDLVHMRSRVSDWAWGYNGVPFTYSDGTTVTQKASQGASFIGVTYIYKLQ